MSEKLRCAIETGYEYDEELITKHHRLGAFVLSNGGIEIIADRAQDVMPMTPEDEALYERRRLETIADDADMMALWLNGQPPRNRIAVAAGFAAARGIPIVGLRTEKSARTGEDGLQFNLMLHAAIEYSKNPNFGYDDTPHIADSLSELSEDIAQLTKVRAAHHEQPEFEEKGAYVASPYGFSESTKNFYSTELLPLVARHVGYVDPWAEADKEVEIALAAAHEPAKQAAAWTVLGISHLERIRRAKMYIGCMDQEPADVGTLVEVGAAAGFGKPVVIYRNDLRSLTEGPSQFDATIQAAANLGLPEDEAIQRHDNFPRKLNQLEEEIARVVQRIGA